MPRSGSSPTAVPRTLPSVCSVSAQPMTVLTWPTPSAALPRMVLIMSDCHALSPSLPTVCGTASNGIDYVVLPGVVTIPAGQRRADITIAPLDDGPPDITSTVVLKLIADSTGTNYLLGLPRSAAAIILDSVSPRAVTGIIPGSAFNLSATGPDGAWFHVEYSTDMIHWTPICTNQVVNGSINYIDPDAATNPSRFYSTVPETVPPQ